MSGKLHSLMHSLSQLAVTASCMAFTDVGLIKDGSVQAWVAAVVESMHESIPGVV